jgi:hypothetical protein
MTSTGPGTAPPIAPCEGFRSIVNQNFPTDANKKAKI